VKHWELVEDPQESETPFRGWKVHLTGLRSAEEVTLSFELTPGSSYSYGRLRLILETDYVTRTTLPRRVLIHPDGRLEEID
jgi:hypothetical protein